MEPVNDQWADAAVATGMSALDLRQLGDTTFEGDSLPLPGGRVFGGQVLAQALIATGRTVAESRQVHSLHGYFLRPGDASKPIRFEVEILRDGKSFSARRAHAFQGDRPILSMTASFQEDQEGAEHQVTMPEVPPPLQVQSDVEVLDSVSHLPHADFWLQSGPFELRHVEGSLYLGPDELRRPYQSTWMRVRTPLDTGSQLMHRALLVFGSDQVMLEPLLRRHGASWANRNMAFASLDHAMWWHRPVRADEWLLFVQDAPTAQGGRGLTGTWIFSEDGRLVASAAQEGMLRLPD